MEKVTFDEKKKKSHVNLVMSANFTSMVKSKFLSNPEDLGVVAVGFSGGQVCCFLFSTRYSCRLVANDKNYRAKPVSTMARRC